MQVWIPNQVVGECLDGGDHADANAFAIDSSDHELVDTFVAGAGELGEEFAAVVNRGEDQPTLVGDANPTPLGNGAHPLS